MSEGSPCVCFGKILLNPHRNNFRNQTGKFENAACRLTERRSRQGCVCHTLLAVSRGSW